MDNLYLAAACAVVPGLGRKTLTALCKRLGSARAVFEADAQTLCAAGVREAAVEAFITTRDKQLPAKIDYYCRKLGMHLVSLWDEEYPEALRTIGDPPVVLYVLGKLPQEKYCCAIVGSRNCTGYGERAAEYFATSLARQGIPIISGGAKGIDAAAHRATLLAGGVTVAVVGCGLDIDYPESNAGLFRKIVEQGGAVISEYPPGTKPLSKNFPARNRIIVGLSQGVLVAEAAERSGATITANIAADEGREVYCVPGNIFDGTSIGCHELIRTGAKLVDTPQHILEDKVQWELGMSLKATQPSIFDYVEQADDLQPTPAPAPKRAATELGNKLLELLQGGAHSLEDLTEASGADFATVSLELLELEAAGLAGQDQARRYYRR